MIMKLVRGVVIFSRSILHGSGRSGTWFVALCLDVESGEWVVTKAVPPVCLCLGFGWVLFLMSNYFVV